MKNLLFRIYDWLSLPFTYLSSLHFWLLRRYGIPNFPQARSVMLRRGIFPIRRHFYEPQFHPDDLPDSFGKERSLPGIDLKTDEQLRLLKTFKWQDELKKFDGRKAAVLEDGTNLTLDNPGFHPGDIDFYYQLIRLTKPRKIIEIGSGNSTIVALSALEECKREDPGYDYQITAVEPYPWFRHKKLRLIDQFVERVPLEEFTQLEAGDILFIDSSHMLRPCGDVEHEYLRILPVLRPGVIIHIHDIFTPFDYPDLWVKELHNFWNEQYLLEALLSGGGNYEIFAALHYLSRSHPEEAKAAMPLLTLRDRHPNSFWIRKLH